MGKEFSIVHGYFGQIRSRLFRLVLEPQILLLDPALQMRIDTFQNISQDCFPILPVIAEPAPDDRVVPVGNVLKSHVGRF